MSVRRLHHDGKRMTSLRVHDLKMRIALRPGSGRDAFMSAWASQADAMIDARMPAAELARLFTRRSSARSRPIVLWSTSFVISSSVQRKELFRPSAPGSCRSHGSGAESMFAALHALLAR